MVQEKGKYTVITGASSGIGDETAKAFAEHTFIVVGIPDRSFPIHTAHLKSVLGCSLFR